MRDSIARATSCQDTVRGGRGPDTGTALSLLCEGRAGAGQGDRASVASCLYSNNAIQTPNQTPPNSRADVVCALAGLLTPYQKKQAHILAADVQRLVARADDIGQIGLLTLTFPDNVTDHHEAYGRFNSLNNNFLKEHPEIIDWICVKERQKRGSWHYHLVVLLRGNILEDFDFDLYEDWLDRRTLKQNKHCPTGCIYLRSIWALFYDVLPRYGFGRIFSLEPIKSNSDGLARYVGKYISKHMGSREKRDKGVRLISASKGWVRNSVKFAWNTPNSQLWRSNLARLANLLGFDDMSGFTKQFGPNWAYHLADVVMDVGHWERYQVIDGKLLDRATGEELF